MAFDDDIRLDLRLVDHGVGQQLARTQGQVQGFNRQVNTGAAATRQFNNALGNTVKNAMRATAALVATGGAIGGIARGISTMVGFEQSMAQVKAISNATEEEFKALNEAAKHMGATTSFSATEASKGLQFLAMAGFDTKKSIESLPAVLNLAKASGQELGLTADQLTNIMSGFGLGAEDSTHVANVLAAAASNANTDVTEMAMAMKFAAPASKSLGISLEDTSAAIMVLANSGIKGGMAGRNFQTSMIRLIKPTDEAKQAILRAGLSLEDVNPKMVDFGTLMQNLSNLDTEGIATVFGAENFKSMVTILDQANTGLYDMKQVMTNVDGEAQRMADTMGDTTAGAWKLLLSAIDDVFISMGEDGALGAIRSVIEATRDWVVENKEVLTKVIPTVVEVGIQVGKMWLIFKGAALVKWFAAAGTAALSFGTKATAAMTALNAAVAKVTLAIAAMVAAYKAGEYVGEKLSQHLFGAKEARQKSGGSITKARELSIQEAQGKISSSERKKKMADLMKKTLAEGKAAIEQGEVGLAQVIGQELDHLKKMNWDKFTEQMKREEKRKVAAAKEAERKKTQEEWDRKMEAERKKKEFAEKAAKREKDMAAKKAKEKYDADLKKWREAQKKKAEEADRKRKQQEAKDQRELESKLSEAKKKEEEAAKFYTSIQTAQPVADALKRIGGGGFFSNTASSSRVAEDTLKETRRIREGIDKLVNKDLPGGAGSIAPLGVN